MFWLRIAAGLAALTGVMYSLPRLPGLWRRLVVFCGWLSIGLTTFACTYYSFIEAFSCDDGLKTGPACHYAYVNFYLGFFTFLGVLIWGGLRLLPRR